MVSASIGVWDKLPQKPRRHYLRGLNVAEN